MHVGMFFIFLDDHDEHPILISMLCLLESYPIQDDDLLTNDQYGQWYSGEAILDHFWTENSPSRHLFRVKLSSFMYFYVRFTNQLDPNSVSMWYLYYFFHREVHHFDP